MISLQSLDALTSLPCEILSHTSYFHRLSIIYKVKGESRGRYGHGGCSKAGGGTFHPFVSAVSLGPHSSRGPSFFPVFTAADSCCSSHTCCSSHFRRLLLSKVLLIQGFLPTLLIQVLVCGLFSLSIRSAITV